MTGWPWPRDSREDRAKRVALSYRRLLDLALDGQIDDPAAALAALDQRWIELGAGWVQPAQTSLDLDEWLSPRELGELLHLDPRMFRDWARRGRIRVMIVSGERRYCVGDVVQYQKTRGLRRIGSMDGTCNRTEFG